MVRYFNYLLHKPQSPGSVLSQGVMIIGGKFFRQNNLFGRGEICTPRNTVSIVLPVESMVLKGDPSANLDEPRWFNIDATALAEYTAGEHLSD